MQIIPEDIRRRARERLTGICRVCRDCDGRACAGQVPGMGGVGSGSAFVNNIRALRRWNLVMRTVHNARNPDASIEMFGVKLDGPILAAPIAGVEANFRGCITEHELAQAVVKGACLAGTLGMTGDGVEPQEFSEGISAIRSMGGHGIPVIKPWPISVMKERICIAEDEGVVAIGIDVDGIGLPGPGSRDGAFCPKTCDELEHIIHSTRLPVIIKGIMTPDEAILVREAGAAAIIVSNHGGRVLDYTPGTAEVLPRIVDAVGPEIPILVDGGARYGSDVLKFLGLGARAVLVGRPVAIAAVGGGPEGVRAVLQALIKELRSAMMLTGCADLSEVDSRVIALAG